MLEHIAGRPNVGWRRNQVSHFFPAMRHETTVPVSCAISDSELSQISLCNILDCTGARLLALETQ